MGTNKQLCQQEVFNFHRWTKQRDFIYIFEFGDSMNILYLDIYYVHEAIIR